MTPEMAFECLLVSQDPDVLRPITPILKEFSIDTRVCSDASQIEASVGPGNLDLLVLDVDADESLASVRCITERKHTKQATVLAIVASDSVPQGAHFLLKKPVTRDSGWRSLKTVYSRMLRDYRKHTRFAVMNRVLAMDENKRVIPLIVTNIGEGGAGLACKHQLAIGSILDFETTLPGISHKVKIRARVLWTREYGTAGCEFVQLPAFDLQILYAWLESRYRVKKPTVNLEH